MILTPILNPDGSVRLVKVFINGASDHRALRNAKSVLGHHVQTCLSDQAKAWLDENNILYKYTPKFSDSVDLLFYREVDAVAFKLCFG
jgi:hypothetical protein